MPWAAGENVMDLVQLGEQADLAIVVGGDGNMLGAARCCRGSTWR
jgi:NAD+ kinase